MRKAAYWLAVIAIGVFVINWAFVGLNLLDGNYDITVGAYIALISYIIMMACILYIKFTNKCPHCGKLLLYRGRYCSHCGREIK